MRICLGLGSGGLAVGVWMAVALGSAWAEAKAPPAAEAKPAEAAKPAETKPAEAKPAEAKPAEAKPAEAKPAEAKPAEAKPAEAKPAEKPKRPKTPWSTYSAQDGRYAWAEPSGWVLDEAHSVGGVNMTWNEPGGGGGTFRIVAYPKTGASLMDLVKAASYGGKPRPSKAWMCAQGEHGDLKVAVAARVLDSGDYLLLVLSASPSTFKWLGGLPGVRLAANAVMGFKTHGGDWSPGE